LRISAHVLQIDSLLFQRHHAFLFMFSHFMTHTPDDAACWWRDGTGLQRVVADLLGAELAALRPGRQTLAQPWPASLDLRVDLGADSLELMGLASALETQLHLQGTADAPLLKHTLLADWLDAARAGLDAHGSALTFRTSGSSGAPKPCTHPLALLWQEVEALARLLPGRRRIVSLVPAHHIYGFLFTVLLPRRLGIDAVCDLRGHAPAALAARLKAGDLVIGHPDLWRAFGQAAGTLALAPDIVGVTSTAPCPLDVARAALGTGLARLVQVYGSSETAGIGWRDEPEGGYTLFPYWSRTGEADAQADGLERQCPDGTRQPAMLQDRLAWRDDGRFQPDGRIDQAVQVGGVNVFPGYVADVLRLHPAVLEASVRRMRPDEGERLKAFVVVRDGVTLDAGLQAALHAWLSERLTAPECPAAYSFGPRLPRGASGKLADWIIDSDV
jgi:long-chain acyl-CoA synthetase